MSKDKGVSEVVAVMLLIAIAVVIVGIIAVFFFSNTNVQKIPEVDLSFSTDKDQGILVIYEQRGEPLYYNSTEFYIGTKTVSRSNKNPQLQIKKKNDTEWKLWKTNPSLPYVIGDSLRWKAPDGVLDQVSVDVIYSLQSGNSLLIDRIGYQYGQPGNGGGGSGGGSSITVSQPNGGETWTGNTNHTIIWATENVTATSYTLEYSSDNGITWHTIAIVSGNETDYIWTVPSINTDEALVRITVTGTTITDESDYVFSIHSLCTSQVTARFSTNPANTITTQNTLDITFTDSSTSDDATNHPINSWLWEFGDGTVATGKGPHGHHYTQGEFYARLTVDNGCTNQRTGGVYISVGNPGSNSSKVTVTTPNGGEDYGVGTTQTITWTPDHLQPSSYTIQYSTDGGSNWNTVATNVPGTSTSYNWLVPNTPTTQALIQVIGYDGTGTPVSDKSDNPFTISAIHQW